jgi:hypothetical protein
MRHWCVASPISSPISSLVSCVLQASLLGPLAEYAAANKLLWQGYGEALFGGIAGLARMARLLVRTVSLHSCADGVPQPQLAPESDESRQLSVLCAATAQAAPVLLRYLFAEGPLKACGCLCVCCLSEVL